MSDGIHLLIPFASCRAQGCQQVLGQLALPQLSRLLARLAPQATDEGDEHTLSPPHDRALARELGLVVADGRIPLAAWQAKQAGLPAQDAPWARLTPCHWRVGSDHVAMDIPADLQLSDEESRALLGVMQPYFEQDGIALSYRAPDCWLASAEVFRDFPAASLDRVSGRPIDDWMPRTPQARPVRRLQQEMQMLLYTHPVSDARERLGRQPVNSFWVSDTGALAGDEARAWPAGTEVAGDLRATALRGDWDAWATAWSALDARAVPPLLAAVAAGRRVTVTLCGERHAQPWSNAQLRPIAKRLAAWLQRPRIEAVLNNL